MQHGWHPSDPVIIQILVVGGVVVNGLFTAYDRWRRRQWEKEDLLMRAQAAKEREDISTQIQANTDLTAMTSEVTAAAAAQVAEAHGKSLEGLIKGYQGQLSALLNRKREEADSAEAEARAGRAG